MDRFNRIHFAIILLILAMIACQIPSVEAPQPFATQDINSIIVQTANAAMTMTALVSTSIPQETLTPSQTATITMTATNTPSLTSVITNTLPPPMISVSISTNCRNGPGKVYDYQSALIVGEVVEIFARETTGNYWYIRNPEATEEAYCWVWGKYATIEGDVSVLPMYTPPPTPTATNTSVASITPTVTTTKKASAGSFVVSYNNTDSCGGDWWVDFKLRNNGSISFQSMKITIKDMNNNNDFVKTSNVFTDIAGCSTVGEKDVLDPGDILLLSGPNFSYDPTGHKLRISVTLCTNNGQGGTCIKQNFDVQL